MTLTEFYNEVSKHTDTDKTAIGVADTKRVLAVAFAVLHTLPTADVLDLIAKGLAAAGKKAAAKK
jgi:hypothetical protein